MAKDSLPAAWARPRVRAVEVLPTEVDGQPMYCLRDHLSPEGEALLVSRHALLLISLIDGERDLAQVGGAFALRTGVTLPPPQIEQFLHQLDNACLIEGGRYAKRLAQMRGAY